MPKSLNYPVVAGRPDRDGWFWCYWRYHSGAIDYDTPIPLEFYNGAWRDDMGRVLVGVPPALAAGPIPYPVWGEENPNE